ncbi:hypothetical protein BY996DRAFT_6538393 [Phakopsora pachyrhizi]|nr:hypothetical protein BY996DRAFT_6538393 [Phakopsora pachyrhizi]
MLFWRLKCIPIQNKLSIFEDFGSEAESAFDSIRNFEDFGSEVLKADKIRPAGEQYAQTIRELEIEDLMESESNSDREEDILLLHNLYTKCYLAPCSSIKLLKTYSTEDLMQLSPSSFKKLTRTTHISYGKLCNLLRGDSIFYNSLRQKQIALEIQVDVDLSHPGSDANGASIGKIQMIFGFSQVMQLEGFPNCVGFVD